MGLLLRWEMVLRLSREKEFRWSTVRCWLVVRACFGFHEDQLSISWLRRSSVSSSSWAPLVCVACPFAAGSVGVVVEMGGRGTFWLFESATHKVVFQGMGLGALPAWRESRLQQKLLHLAFWHKTTRKWVCSCGRKVAQNKNTMSLGNLGL